MSATVGGRSFSERWRTLAGLGELPVMSEHRPQYPLFAQRTAPEPQVQLEMQAGNKFGDRPCMRAGVSAFELGGMVTAIDRIT
jgi:hypothetical protein